MEKVKIALLGLGKIGTGVWKIFEENKEEIIKRSGYDVEIKKILVKDLNKVRGIVNIKNILTTDVDDILEDSEIQIVVELMGGVEPARNYIIKALRNKKHIVTANKMLLATRGDEIFKEAEKNKVTVKYEASVAGGIPVISGINEGLTANKIEKLYGIVNGTANYILSKMNSKEVDFKEALKEAQSRGYAEFNPTSDVDGFDSQYKLAILASLCFGTKVKVNNIYREGITNINSLDIEYAKELGYKIKLLSIAKSNNDKLELRVHPTMILKDHPLATVEDNFNAIFINGNAVGDLMFYGRGSGDLPTGSAVVGDIIDILKNNINKENYLPVIKDNLWQKEFVQMSDVQCRYYIRATVIDEPGVLGEITKILGENKVSLRSVIQRGIRHEGQYVTLVFETHLTEETNIINSIDSLYELNSVNKIDNLIRIEEL